MCIHIVSVSMGIVIPWKTMLLSFLLSPWFGTRLLADAIPLMYRSIIVSRFRLIFLLTLIAKMVDFYQYITHRKRNSKATGGDFEMALWRLNVNPAAPLTTQQYAKLTMFTPSSAFKPRYVAALG